jgi:hypothetical protein
MAGEAGKKNDKGNRQRKSTKKKPGGFPPGFSI